MKYNYGVALLKIAACFGVVCVHFGKSSLWTTTATPLFMFVAMYLSAGALVAGGVLARMKRLYLPFAIWGLAYYTLYSIANHRADILCLLQQLTLGVPACPPLYFMMLLMVSTVIIYWVGRLSSAFVQIAVLMGIELFCFAMQYTGMNALLFGSLTVATGAAFGRLVELLPVAIAGYLTSRYVKRRCWLIAVALVSLTLYAVTAYCKVGRPEPGFCYQGLGLHFLTIGIALLFISFGGLWSGQRGKWLAKAVKAGASLTAGIYYVHLLVGKSMEAVIGRNRGMVEACGVFALSLLVIVAMKRVRLLSRIVQ